MSDENIVHNIDLLFMTEMWGKQYKSKKENLLKLVQQWKRDGTTIPLFYHPGLHMIIVRFDDTVEPQIVKKFHKELLKLDYEFEIYIRTKEVLQIEF